MSTRRTVPASAASLPLLAAAESLSAVAHDAGPVSGPSPAAGAPARTLADVTPAGALPTGGVDVWSFS